MAAQRARWLAELAEALDEARRVTRGLAASGSPEAVELAARIESASREAEALRLRSRASRVRDQFGPEWTENLPWKQSAWGRHG